MKHVVFIVLCTLVLGVGGVYADNEKPSHSVLGIPTHPYGALTFTRPFDVEDISVGFKVGVEAEVEPFFLGLEVHLRDILSDVEIYPWDGEFEISLGAYW
jgi:hypothetical protein